MKPSQRRMKRKSVRIPSGKSVTRTLSGKPGDHVCAICRARLQVGTGRKSASEVSKLPASRRRISRPYGAHLCTACTRKLFSLRAMLEAKEIRPEDIEIKFKKYV